MIIYKEEYGLYVRNVFFEVPVEIGVYVLMINTNGKVYIRVALTE